MTPKTAHSHSSPREHSHDQTLNKTEEKEVAEGIPPTQLPLEGEGAASLRSASNGRTATARTTGQVEAGVEVAGDRAWKVLRKRPYLGVAVAGSVGFAAASLVGVGELAIAIAAGYAAYQVLKKNIPPSRALKKAVEFEKEMAGL